MEGVVNASSSSLLVLCCNGGLPFVDLHVWPVNGLHLIPRLFLPVSMTDCCFGLSEPYPSCGEELESTFSPAPRTMTWTNQNNILNGLIEGGRFHALDPTDWVARETALPNSSLPAADCQAFNLSFANPASQVSELYLPVLPFYTIRNQHTRKWWKATHLLQTLRVNNAFSIKSGGPKSTSGGPL